MAVRPGFQLLLRIAAQIVANVGRTDGDGHSLMSCSGLSHKVSRALTLASVTAAVALIPGVLMAQSASIDLKVDTSQRITLRGTASSVIVANPAIADVTVVDANTLFITGKGYGTTDVVAVDAIGRTLFQGRIVVTGGAAGSVRLWRGAEVTEMTCSQSCSPSLRSSGGGGNQTP